MDDIGEFMGGRELLAKLWTEDSRPTADWLRIQARAYQKDKSKGIPCRKVLKQFFFKEAEVRERLGLETVKK